MATRQIKYFIGLSSFEMLAMFRRGLFYAYLSIYLRHFLGLSVTETTLFATLPMTLNILAQTFIWGRISDRYQLRRSMIIIGELLAGIGTLVVWLVHRRFETPVASGYAIIFGLTIIEIFWSMSNIAWSAWVSDIYDAGQRSRIQGRLSSMGGLGRMFGVWAGGLLYDGLGLKYAGWGFYEGGLFFVSAAIMFVSTIPLFFLPEGGSATRVQPPLQPGPKPERQGTSTGLYVVFLLSMVFINFGRNSVAIIFPQYLALDAHQSIDSLLLSHIINTQSVAIVVFGLLAGWIGRRIGDANTVIAGSVAAVAALILLVFFTSLPMLFFSSFLRGVADVLILASSYAYASILIPAEIRAQRFAWFNATFFLSWGLAGTLIAGPVVDTMTAAGYSQNWAYRMSFASAAGTTFIGLVLLAILIAYRRKMTVRQAAPDPV